MISRNLRHFRVFLAVAELGSLTAASVRARISQSAVTQSLAKMEREVGAPLFDRTSQGLFLTKRGEVLELRLRRAMARLDADLGNVSRRLPFTATATQLQVLIAMTEAQNSALAARMLGRAQPTIHRAITQFEHEAERTLFDRTSFGMIPTRPCLAIARAAQLAFSEFQQADADLAEFEGREVGRIVVGSLPLSRSVILPEAIVGFRKQRPTQIVTVIDGPYVEMLAGLRRGDLDMIIGALRDPLPIDDVVQEMLISDRLVIVSRPDHPIVRDRNVEFKMLVQHPWAVPRQGTPSRDQFDAMFAEKGVALPDSIVECGSILLMRELLGRSDLLGCISGRQAAAEIRNGLLVQVDADVHWPLRAIGLTTRVNWVPTKAQALLIDELRNVAAKIPPV